MMRANEETTTFRTRAAAARSNVVPFPGAIAPAPSGPHDLKRSETERQALQSIIPDLIFTVRKDGLVLETHAPKDNEMTVSANTAVGKRIKDLLPTQIGQQATHYIEKALRTGQTQVFSIQHSLPSRLRVFEARICPSGPDEVFALVRDVTDRKLLQKEILEITNRERVQIGQDLHDGLGQHLTGITFLSRALESKLLALNLPEARDAAEISKLVMQALSQTRNLARGLFPVELEESGLIHALKELASTVEQLFSITCVFDCEDKLAIRNRAAENHLFRLSQEAINNSVKHGKAKHVTIGLKRSGERVLLSIADDGVGFSNDPSKSTGLGLRIMNYRAQKIGAALEIQPGNASGTVVLCTFPNNKS
ncbi:MAG: histidine kinase [Verrucomicrobia subdivision 3 bacterium]|nr:histidine kinase [Limisphaerales bacterium]